MERQPVSRLDQHCQRITQQRQIGSVPDLHVTDIDNGDSPVVAGWLTRGCIYALPSWFSKVSRTPHSAALPRSTRIDAIIGPHWVRNGATNSAKHFQKRKRVTEKMNLWPSGHKACNDAMLRHATVTKGHRTSFGKRGLRECPHNRRALTHQHIWMRLIPIQLCIAHRAAIAGSRCCGLLGGRLRSGPPEKGSAGRLRRRDECHSGPGSRAVRAATNARGR